MDYSRFMTNVALHRKAGAVRALGKKSLTDAPADNVYMSGGLPTPDGNPFIEATFKLRDGTELVLTEDLMKHSLQYFLSQEYKPLMDDIKDLLYECHSPPLWDQTAVIPCVGGLDGIARFIDITVNEGDYFIIQEPCYQTFITLLNAYQVKYLSVESDSDGPIPDSLRSVLSKWKPQEMAKAKSGVPKVMYLNPTATNPSGISVSDERRQEIYQIACEYNLLILEDDAYYFVQFGPPKSWPRSYLSYDTEGRVMRFDSCSKIIAAGLRLGFVTGPRRLVESIKIHMEVSAQQPSSLSQVLVAELMKKWGRKGFWDHVKFISNLYQQRRDATIAAAEKHLKGLCDWDTPSGGMFLWIKVHGLADTWSLAEKCILKGITFGPGSAFAAYDKPSSYIRLAYSVVPLETVDKGFERLAEGIREELQLQAK